MMTTIVNRSSPLPKCPIKRRPINVQECGHVLAALAVVDQLAGVVDLLRRQLRLSPEFHATALRGSDAGAGALADKASLQFRQDTDHLPHGATGRRLGVDCFRKGDRKSTRLNSSHLVISYAVF